MCVPFKLIPFGIFLVLFGIQSSCANLQQQETLQSSSLKTVGKSLGRRSFLVQVGNGIELEAVRLQFEPYRWRPCGVTWDSSRTVVVIKLRRISALICVC